MLISKMKYEQLLPNTPPPSETIHIKRPPPGLPENDQAAQTGKQLTPTQVRAIPQIGMGDDNELYMTDVDSDSEQLNRKSVSAGEDWSKHWQAL